LLSFSAIHASFIVQALFGFLNHGKSFVNSEKHYTRLTCERKRVLSSSLRYLFL